MDTAAYLSKHGWQGKGHSLHPSKPTSLRRPLLISKKIDVLGLGIGKNDSVSDQWWLRAFDSSLAALGTGKGKVGDTALGAVRVHGVRKGGLYARFVRGERLEGSLDPASSSTPSSTSSISEEGREKERKSGVEKKIGAERNGSNKKMERKLAILTEEILSRSRSATASEAEAEAESDLPTVALGTDEEKRARRAARAVVRKRREERRELRSKAIKKRKSKS